MSEVNPFLPPRLDSGIPGELSMIGNALPKKHAEILNSWYQNLVADGLVAHDDTFIVGWLRRQFADERLISGLADVEQQSGITATDYVRSSYKYMRWHNRGETFEGPYKLDVNEKFGSIALGDHPLNTYADGTPRRYEEGDLVSINAVRRAGIDPTKVLFYRVTQPASDPKPEFYWTSDSLEVRRGLQRELSNQVDTAIVLVSTLDEISKNGGLIDDINDDQGHAVRQAGFEVFDQQQVLFTFKR